MTAIASRAGERRRRYEAGRHGARIRRPGRVGVRRLHTRQLVTSVVSFQVRGRPVTDIRFAFEALQHGHDAKTFGFATEGPSLTRQEFAEERDNNVLTYGRCLSARALRVASLLTEPPCGCLGPSGIAIANGGGFASQLPNRGGSFATKRPPPDVFGQAPMEHPPQ